MPKIVTCRRCGAEIKDSHDLMVVAYWGIFLRPYHTACYGEMEKTLSHQFFTRSMPVNHAPGLVYAVMTFISSLGPFLALLLFTKNVGLASLSLLSGLWPVTLRILSYVEFERPVMQRAFKELDEKLGGDQ